jgi:DNA ligase-1
MCKNTGYSNKMGSLLCSVKDGEMVKLGTGFTDNQRKNPPAIGTSVTFKYYGLKRIIGNIVETTPRANL